MNIKLIFLLALIYYVRCEKAKTAPLIKTKDLPKNFKDPDNVGAEKNVSKINLLNNDSNKSTNTSVKSFTPVMKVKLPPVPTKTTEIKMIPPELIQEWAAMISQKLYKNEQLVVRRDLLLKSFADVKMENRNGAAIVDKMAAATEELLQRRAKAAENIMRKAEELQKLATPPPEKYLFDESYHLDELKKIVKPDPSHPWISPRNCTSLRRLSLDNQTHFGASARVSIDASSVHIAAEVFPCDERVKQDIYWSEELLSTYKQNYAEDSMLDFQYFCSVKGFLRHYPAALWSSMFSLSLNPSDDEEGVGDVYDCRLRPWYVSAGGAPRDVLILFDASGSMNQSSNNVHAEQFTLALLSALTDDDQVNVLRFNVLIESPISCFNDRLVPANHVNSAAMMSALKVYRLINETNMTMVLDEAVNLLHRQLDAPDRPNACQQVIVLLTDSLYFNYTELMAQLDPNRHIRVFVLFLHDEFGLRDNTRELGEMLSCHTDGYFAELTTDADVTEQVMRILQVLERPLVAQRKKRLKVFSDVYAHVEDPRRSEYYWLEKENAEQHYRYSELRHHKQRLLDGAQLYKDYIHQQSLDLYGQYYEGQDLDYRLQISVSVPVFDSKTSENITIRLFEEKQRDSTRRYPVNRLLGVAGVDIPLEHLKLFLPYHQLGPGGSLFIIDHRGNIVLHNNTKPTFDGDILKPGYRTVDVLDLEQPAIDLPPREYSPDWLEFRRALVLDHPKGNRTLYGKNIFDGGMRATLELREYHWRRVLDTYTAVVVLPQYNRRHPAPDGSFTQELAEKAEEAIRTELSVHPDWLYCRHVDTSFDEREFEVRHFIGRRKTEENFQMQNLKHTFSPIKYVPYNNKPYICNEALMARLCKDAIATAKWIEEDNPGPCSVCELGPVTAFFASESGLTRWRQYHTTSQHAEPPSGSVWARGPSEPWYRRAAAAPDTLLVHAPVTPLRRMRNSDARPPALGVQYRWLTAARTIGHPEKGIIGVAGYHFYPQHLEDLLYSITGGHCKDDDKECKPHCDGETWICVLVDDGGWIVAGHWREEEDIDEEDPITEHLARVHPQAMSALLTAGVFKLHWIHDYQGVCFPPLDDDDSSSAAMLMPSLLRSLTRSVTMLFRVATEIVTILTILNAGSVAGGGETEAEREKRRKRLRKDYEREKYDRLFDKRVLVNRTRIAACDRSRAFYVLQRTPRSLKALKTPPDLCSWPLAAAIVPDTNLLLLAVNNNCKYSGRPVPDPLINKRTDIGEGEMSQSSPERLACRRNKVPLPARPPPSACYPHHYTHEAGYRQCGPWLPNPEQEEDIATHIEHSPLLFGISLALCLNCL